MPPNADAGICYQDMGYDDMNMMDQHELIAMNSSEPPLHAENHYAHNQQYYYVHDSNVVGDGTDCFANNFAYETTGWYFCINDILNRKSAKTPKRKWLIVSGHKACA